MVFCFCFFVPTPTLTRSSLCFIICVITLIYTIINVNYRYIHLVRKWVRDCGLTTSANCQIHHSEKNKMGYGCNWIWETPILTLDTNLSKEAAFVLLFYLSQLGFNNKHKSYPYISVTRPLISCWVIPVSNSKPSA